MLSNLVTGLFQRVSGFVTQAARLSLATKMERKITVDGIDINYLQTGCGPQTIFCLPGTFGSIWTDFQPQIEGLDKSKFTIIVWDPPGFGKSRPPDKTYSLNFYENDAEWAQKFLQELGVSQCSLMGWSDGGIAALILASTNSQLVDRLVVWGCKSHILKSELLIYTAMRDLIVWSPSVKDPLLNIYGEKYFSHVINAYMDTMHDIYYQRGGDICQALLPNISCPAFLLWGKKDTLVAHAHADNLRATIKPTRFYEFPDGKHNIHLRYSAEFNELVQEFLTSSEQCNDKKGFRHKVITNKI